VTLPELAAQLAVSWLPYMRLGLCCALWPVKAVPSHLAMKVNRGCEPTRALCHRMRRPADP
jgi:hypothetical protein